MPRLRALDAMVLVSLGFWFVMALGCTIEGPDPPADDSTDALRDTGGSEADTGGSADPPVAVFSVVTAPARAHTSVEFAAETTSAFNYSWEFGDGLVASGSREVSHVYLERGEYTVTLFVAGDGGTDEVSRTITVVDPLPRADFSINPNQEVIAGKTTVTMENRAEFAETYTWDFGDGTTSTQAEPSHVFEDVGLYTVALTATNAEGSETAMRSVRVYMDPAIEVYITEIVYEDLPFQLSSQSPFVLPPTGTEVTDGRMDMMVFAAPSTYYADNLLTAEAVEDLYTFRSTLPRIVEDEDDFPKTLTSFTDIDGGVLFNEAIPMTFAPWYIHTWEYDDTYGPNLLHQIGADAQRVLHPYFDFADVDESGVGAFVSTINVDHEMDTGTRVIVRYRHGAP